MMLSVKQEQNLSIISKLELLGFNFTSSTDEEETKEFVAKSEIYTITPEIELETINIRKAIKIKLADAIIAATAIVNQFTLLTRNVTDFDHIDGLSIENPFD